MSAQHWWEILHTSSLVVHDDDDDGGDDDNDDDDDDDDYDDYSDIFRQFIYLKYMHEFLYNTYLIFHQFTWFPLAPEVDLLIEAKHCSARGDRCAGVLVLMMKLCV